jgi:endogenous inhibitor of DNA gyrase (YacG/DUF329 family)
MPLKKGEFNSGIKNLKPFPKGKSGYHHNLRIVKCQFCGNDFPTIGPCAKYCSTRCKEKCRPDNQKKDFICEFCHKRFKRRATNNVGRFCSRQCSGLWNIANGNLNYFYRAFLYLPHRCDICSNNDFSVLLIHHKDRNRNNNLLENLQILCANCHYKIHFGNGRVRHTKIIPIINYLKTKEVNNIAIT